MQRQQNYLSDSLGTVIAKVFKKHIVYIEEITNRRLPVLVYGTGGHSERVARIWNHMNLPEINGYLCTSDPEITSFHSTPVFNIDKCTIKSPDLSLFHQCLMKKL